MTNTIEQRYERLLRLYPKQYRRDRGPEMMAVLMESAEPGRRRPAAREQWALVIGAARAHADAAGRRSAAQAWRAALRTAALIVLVIHTGDAVLPAFDPELDFGPVNAARIALSVVAVIAVTRHLFLVAALVTTAVITLEYVPVEGSFTIAWYPLPLVIAFLLPLIRRGPVTVPRSLNHLVALSVIPVAMMVFGTVTRDPSFHTGSRTVWMAAVTAAVLWAVVDERIALSLGLTLLVQPVTFALRVLEPFGGGFTDSLSAVGPSLLTNTAVLMILPLVGLTFGAVTARRRSRL
jgi:hypothetical protein